MSQRLFHIKIYIGTDIYDLYKVAQGTWYSANTVHVDQLPHVNLAYLRRTISPDFPLDYKLSHSHLSTFPDF